MGGSEDVPAGGDYRTQKCSDAEECTLSRTKPRGRAGLKYTEEGVVLFA